MQDCEKILQENLIPKLIGRDNISHHFRGIASLPLIMGSLNIKLSSDYEKILDTYDHLTAISEQENICTKINTLKPKKQTSLELASKKEPQTV